ncbi:[FeFe] hydrogenase H-cluster maturation GTPase HydF [Phocaeicola barnesiae]|uniref:[FeFe] hydrogenase H-cluster maturation GTPase HydF n=1 Tax=Phocaeicola barnesiae TaxID=376804 RepID=UPI001F2CB020|nr:[FeFe] hydrogenase H-cluster maturation GTPase HydF [Phocaeicola barnesiae]MCF2597737.1 [FeFe] hydrogenase H-cluster maturation GTPase HydF [Phocaeicola barnesiae]MDM8250897.1 [FeFe] hydrogenase H-cluster maturation GTPase HydF [Phocaeicola barnesiae]MDM8257302.1 [FeFe] hydrogenase H-cluster maturation GTPase HydF [Phocaeicola barnesiae]MDM8308215.1 [FeFe] hydrogenase H-cluster maturation GTPase HydF [Phocaeicola barnesiae]
MSSLQDTPRAERLHIGLFGKRNSGKSALLNALTNQEVAVVSSVAGTTTDPVYKSMELHGIGPCVFIDTAGFDDEGKLGNLRIEQTLRAVERTDIALMICTDSNIEQEIQWSNRLKDKKIPIIWILNKSDILENAEAEMIAIEQKTGQVPLLVSGRLKQGIESIRRNIQDKMPDENQQTSILGKLVKSGDVVMLVMPQDIQAPKGRLILPQVQTIRELLDRKCIVMSCTTDKLTETLQALANPPQLIITDSQVFKTVYEKKPEATKLTSFSVLFARYKGDIDYFIQGANTIEQLTESSKVLIAEACTHAPLKEDIGRVKIPRLLRTRIGSGLQIDIVSGTDFPQDLSGYDLIIHCGACMFNRKYVLNRVNSAKEQHIPMTNYGVTIAYLAGILDKITIYE